MQRCTEKVLLEKTQWKIYKTLFFMVSYVTTNKVTHEYLLRYSFY